MNDTKQSILSQVRSAFGSAAKKAFVNLDKKINMGGSRFNEYTDTAKSLKVLTVLFPLVYLGVSAVEEKKEEEVSSPVIKTDVPASISTPKLIQ